MRRKLCCAEVVTSGSQLPDEIVRHARIPADIRRKMCCAEVVTPEIRLPRGHRNAARLLASGEQRSPSIVPGCRMTTSGSAAKWSPRRIVCCASDEVVAEDGSQSKSTRDRLPKRVAPAGYVLRLEPVRRHMCCAVNPA